MRTEERRRTEEKGSIGIGEAGARQPGIFGPWRWQRGARSAWALPHPASRSHILRHAILCLRSGRTKSGEQLWRDSVHTLNSSVALTRNRRR